MKNATFRRHLRQLTAAKRRYLYELKVCEAEYERRFGVKPSDVIEQSRVEIAVSQKETNDA